MAHNTKVFPVAPTDGVTTFTSAQLAALDANLFKAIDGDSGGAWAPSSSIDIAGAGVGVRLAATKNMSFGADGGGIRTFNRVLFASPALLIGGALVSSGHVQGQGIGPCFRRLLDNVPNGATITNVSIRVLIKNTHASLPATRPKLSIYRVNAETGVTDYLRADDAGLGLQLADPGTVAAYNALGAVLVNYAPDQNNVKDETHSFGAFVTDEEGGGAISGNLFYAFKVTFTHSEFGVA